MDLLSEIENKCGFWVAKDSDFMGDIFSFTHCKGRIMPCGRPRGGRSLWIQECGTKYIIGIWLGHTYICTGMDEALHLINSLIASSKNMKKILDSSPATEIDTFYLLSEDIKSFVNLDFPLFPTDVIQEKQVIVHIDVIRDFLSLHQCVYQIGSDGWVTFEYAEDNVMFRLSPYLGNGLTSVNVGIEVKICGQRHCQFLSDFSQYVVEIGIVPSATYYGSEYFYDHPKGQCSCPKCKQRTENICSEPPT